MHAERLSTLGQIAASVAHEIGTPLGVISIRLDQLSEKRELAAEKAKIDVMKEQIDRITRIMQRMLDYARPRCGSPQAVSLKIVINRVHDLVEHRLRKQGISLKTNLHDNVVVFADFDEIHQVFLNLLVNASDACRAGDRIVIGLLESTATNRVRVEVADSGDGIKEEVRPLIFEPFFSTKRPAQGTGLGLTIVRDIMQRHGGTIELASSSQGSRFILEWPTPEATTSARHMTSRPS
ncbi:MAG: HAMP domain-containing sensor histidine kinase [Myxococcota bacterium]